MTRLDRIVVVGASLAGLRAAEALRQKEFGGTLTLVGAEPHLPYDRPPLSKEVLKGTWPPEKTSLLRDEGLDPLDLDLRLGCRALSLDSEARTVTLDDGAHIPFDGLVIATGATPRQLPAAMTAGTDGSPLAGVHTLRTLDDCLQIAQELEAGPRVAVIGAGFIGAEVAASCRQRGLEVTLIEPMPIPFGPSLGDDVGQAICAEHRDQGVELRLGLGLAACQGAQRVERIELTDGTQVEADVVIVGIGVRPETTWLENSAVALDDGVLCNTACETSVPGIVAAGDLARWPNLLFCPAAESQDPTAIPPAAGGPGETMRIEHWSNATEQARHAVETLLAAPGEAQPFTPVPFVWSDQYDLKIQSAGVLAGADESRVVHGSLEERKFLKLYARKGRLMGALAFNEPRRLIGYRRQLRQTTSWEDALAAAEA
jgi:3-phenylpropionate/trans-cinnamate dioxygenase ferredoxin reductase subunit